MANICNYREWVEKTTLIVINEGRKLLGCVCAANGCGYFRWVDGHFYHRSHGVIDELLKSIQNNEEEYVG